MSGLATALDEYLALRRSLGYKLERAGELLVDFVAYLDQAGVDHVTVELAVSWAMLAANPDSCWRAQRLGGDCCVARTRPATKPSVSEVPHMAKLSSAKAATRRRCRGTSRPSS